MAKIQVLEGPMKGVQFQIDKEVVFVGRAPEYDIRIRDDAVSRQHLKIFSVEGCYFIEDLKSKNGTMINGEPLEAGFGRLITENDRIQLGLTVIRLDGINGNKPPITVKKIELHPSEKIGELGSSRAYSREDQRSRAFKEMNLSYDLLQAIGEKSSAYQLLEKVTEFLFESYPRIDTVTAFLFDDEKKRMEEIVSRTKHDNDKKRSSYTRAILDLVVQDGKTVTIYLNADTSRDGFANAKDTVALMAVIGLPLMSGEKVRGAIYIEGFGESKPVRAEDILLLKTVKRLLELSLETGDLNKGAAPQSRNRKRV